MSNLPCFRGSLCLRRGNAIAQRISRDITDQVTGFQEAPGPAGPLEHYEYKLAWLASLREMVAAGPEATVVCGDMNIAPTDADVFDPDAYVGQTHVTAPERAALA